MILKKISIRTGFTETEIKVILFLLTFFLAGFTYIKFLGNGNEAAYKEFNYSKEENLLLKSEQNDSPDEEIKSGNKDSLRKQVLELKDRPYGMTTKKEPANRSINLNTASKEDLMKVSGIGEKTAGNILAYREKIGKFRIIDELMNVKGIGETKFTKFRKYLFIE
jgi:comEA protein